MKPASYGWNATRVGLTLSFFDPLPSWPSLFVPQQYASPALVRLHACTMPAEMDLKTNPRDPKTGAGTFGGRSVSVATTASTPHPQQCGAPSRVMPQLKVFPAEIDPNVSPPATGTATGLEAFEPFPSSPYSFVPQQYPLPFMVTPQACPSPVLMEANLSPPETGTGIGLSFSELLPSRPRVFVPQQ